MTVPRIPRKLPTLADVPKLPGLRAEAILGAGAVGIVVRCFQESTGARVAVKLLNARSAKDSLRRKEFLREAQLLKELDHPNLVKGFGWAEAGGVPYSIIELIDGPMLRKVVFDRGWLPEKEVLGISCQVADVLGYLEEHALVHGDLKPENLLVAKDGVIKLCDLGMIEPMRFDPDVVGAHGVPVGTRTFMSPEKWRGERALDIRSDVYSLGLAMYYCATGEQIVPSGTEMSLVPDYLKTARALVVSTEGLRTGFRYVVFNMLAFDRKDRYWNPKLLHKDLRTVLVGGRTFEREMREIGKTWKIVDGRAIAEE